MQGEGIGNLIYAYPFFFPPFFNYFNFPFYLLLGRHVAGRYYEIAVYDTYVLGKLALFIHLLFIPEN